MTDQLTRTIAMVLDADALRHGAPMQCEARALERVALAREIADQLRREGLAR